jgi:hypothetical protein
MYINHFGSLTTNINPTKDMMRIAIKLKLKPRNSQMGINNKAKAEPKVPVL